MINKLRNRMIRISALSVVGVLFAIFLMIYVLGNHQLNAAVDVLTDRISEGNGVFVPYGEGMMPQTAGQFPDFFNEETQFSTRFFMVWLDEDGQVLEVDVNSISSVSEEAAANYGLTAMERGKERGWADRYRYKIFATDRGTAIVFVDGGMNRTMTRRMVLIAGIVLLCSALLIFLLVVFLSGRAAKPIAESYEKQKQFITDANHELKTPLTLILTNLEIVEAEVGKNEWLDDIKEEGQRMSGLVNQLTALSRLDEDRTELQFAEFSLSDMLDDTCSEFENLAQNRHLALTSVITPGISRRGDEGSLRRVVSILLDNAVKYCDPDGSIDVALTMKRHPVLTIENTCGNVDELKLDRLFDRFYRADQARTVSNSFGIGLSLAQSIIRRHHGEITAYKAAENKIGFKVIFKNTSK